MTLIVEDGSIVEGANSFASVTTANDFWADTGNAALIASWNLHADPEKERLLRLASTTLCREFPLDGAIVSHKQTMCMPRVGLYDCSGRAVKCDAIPYEFVEVVCILSLYLSTQPPIDYLGVNTGESDLDNVKRVQDHDVEIAYFESRELKKSNIRSKYPERVFDLMKCYSDAGSQDIVGFVDKVVRW